MRGDLLVVAVIVGVGTWLFRFLPTRLRGLSAARNPRVTVAMESIGPAAIATLFVASILPEVSGGGGGLAPVLGGCAATVLAYRARGDVLLATVTGTLVYGVVYGWMG